jgi:hypothetical protein
MESDKGKKTQNNGVAIVDGPTYYEKLTSIIDVNYYNGTRYVLFKCDWMDIKKDRRYKEDEYGFELMNFKKLMHRREWITDDPFVLSSQVSQVYYVEDERHPNWATSLKTKPKHEFNVGQGKVTTIMLVAIMSKSLST